MAQLSHGFLQFSLDDNATKRIGLKFHHSGARFEGVWCHGAAPWKSNGDLGRNSNKRYTPEFFQILNPSHETVWFKVQDDVPFPCQQMFRFFSQDFFFKAVLGTKVATCQEAYLPPLSHHTAKASGMVSVDLREFGAFVFVLFFGGGKKTRLQSWGTKISALILGQKKSG